MENSESKSNTNVEDKDLLLELFKEIKSIKTDLEQEKKKIVRSAYLAEQKKPLLETEKEQIHIFDPEELSISDQQKLGRKENEEARQDYLVRRKLGDEKKSAVGLGHEENNRQLMDKGLMDRGEENPQLLKYVGEQHLEYLATSNYGALCDFIINTEDKREAALLTAVPNKLRTALVETGSGSKSDLYKSLNRIANTGPVIIAD